MRDLFDTSAIRDEPEYWDALAHRVAAHATRRVVPFDWLAARRARWVAASLLLAASLILALLPGAATRGGVDAALELALAPRDGVGQALASPDAPPAIAMLLLAAPPSGAGR